MIDSLLRTVDAGELEPRKQHTLGFGSLWRKVPIPGSSSSIANLELVG